MNENNEENHKKRARAGKAGPYDAVLFILESFGKALPFVIVMILMAYGSWYAFQVNADLQNKVTELITKEAIAKLKIAEAEADVRVAANLAKYDALREYSENLTELTQYSIQTSTRIQQLVTNQIDTMEKAESLTLSYNKKIQEYHALLLQYEKEKLDELKEEITNAEKEVEEQSRIAKVAEYNNLKNVITSKIDDKDVIDESVLKLLVSTLKQEDILKEAKREIGDKSVNWEMQFILAISIFKAHNDDNYIQVAQKILFENRPVYDSSILSYFISYGDLFDVSQKSILLPFVVDVLLYKDFDEEFREEMFFFLSSTKRDRKLISALKQYLGEVKQERLINYLDSLLISIYRDRVIGGCYRIRNAYSFMEILSPTKATEHLKKARDIPQIVEEHIRCITDHIRRRKDFDSE